MASSMVTGADALQRFRDDILERVDDLRDQLRKTEAAMDAVAEEWKDDQFRKYNEEFSKDKEEIEPLCKTLEEYEKDVLYPMWKVVREYEDL